MSNVALTGTLRDVAEIIGRERALYFAGQIINWSRSRSARGLYGELRIPVKLKPQHRLNELLTSDEAQLLVNVFRGETLRIHPPTALIRRFRNDTIREFFAAGLSDNEIAWRVGITGRQVRNVIIARVMD